MGVTFTPTSVASGFSLGTINTNFTAIQTSFTDALSRTGAGTNSMEADLDMNSNDILNAGLGAFTTLTVGGSPVGSGSGDVVGAASSVDNTVPRFDSTSGKQLQTSSVVIDDSDNVSGVGNLSMSGNITITGTVDGRDIAADGTTLDTAILDADFGSNGIAVRTAAGTYTNRTLTAGNGINITDGDGVSGNPTIEVPTDGITTSLILNGTVTTTKLEDINQGEFLSRSSAGAGNPQAVTAASARNLLNVENGADVTDAANVGAAIDDATDVTTAATGDKIGILDVSDSSALKPITLANTLISQEAISSSYTINDATADATPDGAADFVLTYDASAGVHKKVLLDNLPSAGGGSGDVTGPASATDNAIARFNGTGGKTIQNSGLAIDDSDNVTGANSLTLTSISPPTHSAGILFYDSDVDGLAFYNSNSNVTQHPTRETLIQVRNSSGSTITKGQAVYVSGTHTGTQLPEVELAQADALATADVLGAATADISNNATGFVVTVGRLEDWDTSAFSAGDFLWLDASTAGDLTATRPSQPNFTVPMAVVTRSHASLGSAVFMANGIKFGAAAYRRV